MMKTVDVSELSYAYEDGTVALKDVSVSVEDGEKVAVVGPNGAGKSTLLHLLAGFRMPFTGTVAIAGVGLDEGTGDQVRRNIGLLFQDPDDQIFMPTVEEDVAFGPVNLGMNDVQGRVERALRSVGIEHLAKRRPHRLSYGMKKRVAIAGVLAMDPRVLLLDEPTSGLDPRSRADLVTVLRGIKRTMVIATHDLDAAAEVVDRAVVLNTSVAWQGSMAELVSAKDVLEGAGLEPPQTAKLFRRMAGMGYDVQTVPVTMDQAAAEFAAVIEREAGRRRDGPKGTGGGR
jgi:cobalt/nickel transport system ATP-binding protein